ncbi:unnamed protein product [Thlaspi arvense]|uniref:Uncharacterized protein n=1 Tax=Thlaspi arvense TaxID=13288 RepID=A0AAU9S849_THLAR|nr:unnamed protein product [Thlaspi arvense]
MSSWSFLSDPQGTRFLHFGDSQAYASNPAAGSGATWSRFAKNQQDMRVANEQFRIPSCTYNGGDKQFPFLLVDDSDRSNQAVLNVPICQRHVSLDTSPERGRTQKMLSDGLEPVDSKCALSLLSSHPMQSSETSFSLLPRDVIYPNQLIGTALHFDGLSQYPRSQGVEEKPAELPPHVSSLSSGIFQVAPDDLLEKGASQVLPFSWK